MVIFGVGIGALLVILLIAFFHRPRWVTASLMCSLVSIVVMIGYLGLVDWRVTVVSANFVALLLIFSLSLTVHLIVRYQELHAQNPKSGQGWLIHTTVRDKYQPCLYTVLTTMVGFASLLFSGIRPVIDFGWMMVMGMLVVFIVSFLTFPAFLMLFTPGEPQYRRDYTGRITGLFAGWIERSRLSILLIFGFLAVMSAIGISMLEVENRFIDYFKKSTEIYQGMEVIDRELGGTMPLDVILDPDTEAEILAGVRGLQLANVTHHLTVQILDDLLASRTHFFPGLKIMFDSLNLCLDGTFPSTIKITACQ